MKTDPASTTSSSSHRDFKKISLETSLSHSQMIPKTSIASLPQSTTQNKSYCMLGDGYGFAIVSKELELGKDQPLEFRFQFPDLTKPIKDFMRSREAGEFLSGALAGAMTKAVLAPLETIRNTYLAIS